MRTHPFSSGRRSRCLLPACRAREAPNAVRGALPDLAPTHCVNFEISCQPYRQRSLSSLGHFDHNYPTSRDRMVTPVGETVRYNLQMFGPGEGYERVCRHEGEKSRDIVFSRQIKRRKHGDPGRVVPERCFDPTRSFSIPIATFTAIVPRQFWRNHQRAADCPNCS
jgi:hypothetical protein